MGYIGMLGPKGYRFSAVLARNRVSIWVTSVSTRVWVLHSSLELSMFIFFRRSYFFIIVDNNINKNPSLSLYNIGLNWVANYKTGHHRFCI